LSFLNHTADHRARFEAALARVVPEEPRSLYDPVRHVIAAGGKRIRPMLTALAYTLSRNDDRWMNAGIAIELLHTFTLVHDDIMDNAATRRGLPTVHAKYGTNEAILSGDVMMALAHQALANGDYALAPRMLEEMSIGFIRVCEGQALDKEYELRDGVSVDDYIHMIDLKTAKIAECAAVLGALAAEREDHVEAIRSFAHHVGIAFQIQDDLLDLTAEHADFGKTIGGDILEGKRTYLLVKLLEKHDVLTSEERECVTRVLSRLATSDDIAPMREMMQKHGVIKETESAVEHHTELALRALDSIHEDTMHLREIAEYLLHRQH
jgi:geranylgeranyl diphosphate synthase, type II